jgi:hypothetical protein
MPHDAGFERDFDTIPLMRVRFNAALSLIRRQTFRAEVETLRSCYRGCAPTPGSREIALLLTILEKTPTIRRLELRDVYRSLGSYGRKGAVFDELKDVREALMILDGTSDHDLAGESLLNHYFQKEQLSS